MSELFVMNHPLITHKLSIMRNKKTGSKDFRELLDEIAMLMGYELTRDLPTEDVTIETPITKMKAKMISGKKLAIVPILRAGLGMVDGLQRLIPVAKVGHIGMYRNEETLKPETYYCKLPQGIEDKLVLVVDPMLATGASMVAVYKELIARCGKPAHTHIASVIGCPEGVKMIEQNIDLENDATLWIATVDEYLNENKYIVPGLGDAGDLCFGPKL